MSQEFDLKKSQSALGQLDPIKVAADGEILDGFHRKDVDPNWKTVKLEHIKTTEDKILSKIALNVCRRTVPASEKTEWLRELVKETGWNVKTIAEKSGMSQAWVWMYLPQEFKDKKKVEAGRKGGEKSHIKTTMVPQMVERKECYHCGLGALYPKMVSHPKDKGKLVLLCMDCARKHERGEITLKSKKPVPIQSPKVSKLYRETWAHRKGTMQPAISKMNERIAIRLQKIGVKVETEKWVCVLGTKIDVYCVEFKGRKLELPVFLDGPPHQKEVQRIKDEMRRQFYLKRYGILPLGIDYETDADEDKIFDAIMETIGRGPE